MGDGAMIRTIQDYSREHYARKMTREVKQLRNGKFGIHNTTLGTFVTKDGKLLEFSSEEKARKHLDNNHV